MSAARAAVAAALLAAPAAAQPPTDVVLEQRLATALAADPRLAGLTVSVVDRVAVVGGPVPDPAAKRAADAAVRAVDGLSAVRLNCWVPLSADPYADRVRDRLSPPKPAPPVPAPLPSGDLPPLALPVLGGWLPPPLPSAPSAPPAPEPVTAERQTVDRRGWLGSPVAGGGTIPPAGVPAVPPARFARLTAADARFRRLTVDVSPAGVAVIGGTGDPAAGWELADVLRHQPGVTRGVVGAIAER